MGILHRICIYYIVGLLLVATSARAEVTLSQAYQLSGMKEMTANLARRYVNEGLSQKLSTWVGEAISHVVAGHKGPTLSQKINDPKMRAEMQARIALRLREEIPKLIKSVVYDKLFQGMLSDADPVAQKMVNHIVEAMVKPLNAQADQWAGTLYDKAMERIDPYIKQKVRVGGASINLDATNIKGTIDGVMRLQTVMDVVSGPLSEAMGESAFGEMQTRLNDFLNGNLPPEARRALAAGPDKVDALIQHGAGYLPGAQLEALKAKILALPVMTIPNEVYGSMLAGSAARHFVLAFAAFPDVNPYELNRGREVTQVMIWQLRNKQGFNMSLGQLLDMSTFALGQVGGLPALGAFGRHVAELQNELGKIEATAKELDAQILKYPKEFSAALRERADQVRSALQDYYDKAAKPFQEWENGVEDGLAQGARQITGKIPDWLKVPADWETLKKEVGVPDDIFGDWGDRSVLDHAGVTEAAKKVNDAASDQLASVLVDAAQALLPSPEIKSDEKVPAQNPDEEGDYDPVLLHNGEFVHPVVDVTIPGRGLDFQFKRIYRSRSHFMGRLGWNWTHNFEEALRTWDAPQGAGLTWIDAEGRKFFFQARTDQLGEFMAPAGVFAELRTLGRGEAKRFELKERGGFVTRFDHHGFLQEKCDRFGNCLKCERDAGGQLTAIIDTVGRRMQLAYDRVGRITHIADNSGRTWNYRYDVHGDLAQVISPATDLFPQGIATGYAYAEHLMSQIRDPRGSIFLQNFYGTTGFARGQIIAQSYGEARNIVKSRYVLLRPAWLVARWPDVMNVAIDRVDLRDRRGVVRRFWHNANGNLLRQEIVDAKGKIHPGMQYRYNSDGMRVASIQPSGLRLSEDYWKTNNRLMQGLVVKRVLGETRESHYTYESKFGDLSQEKSPDGVVREWHYDDNGSPLTLTLSHEEREIVTRFRNNSFGQIIAMTDSRGTVTQYDYADGNRTATIQDATGRRLTTHYAYDVVGNITAITLPNGGVRKFDVDAQNLIRREITPLGYERRYDYDAHGNVTVMQVGDFAYHFGYDVLDRLALRQEPVDDTHVVTTRYAYDVDGRLSDVTLPEGNHLRMTYDARGDVTAVERGAGTRAVSFTQYQYDADGNRVAVVDGLGHLTELERDRFGDVTVVIYPNKTREEMERDRAGRVVGTTWKDAAGTTLAAYKNERDALGLSERDLQWDSQNNTWRATQRRFDTEGNLLEEVNPTGAVLRWQYDAFGDVLRAEYPLGVSEGWQYNELGLLVGYQNAAQSKTYFTYDIQGRLLSRTDPNGAFTQFLYDDRDNLLSETPAEGAPIHYTYDGMGRRTQVVWGERITRYDWDGNGRLRALTDPIGRATQYAYDALDRQVSTQYPDGGVERLRYDANAQITERCMPNGNCRTQRYDDMGNLVGRVAGVVRQSYQYDQLGRLVSARVGENYSQFVYSSLSEVLESVQGQSRIRMNYDANGLRSRMMFSDGKSVQWQRDALGRATQVEGPNRFRATQIWSVHGPEKIAYANGRSDTMAYDAMGNVVRQNDNNYSYNLLGNLISQNSITYTYDPWQQLVQSGQKKWHYTLNGEREKVATLQFDKNGNMVSDGRRRYIYDALDRLQEVRDAQERVVACYTYDALNRRVAKEVAGHTTTYVYDGWEPIEIYEDGKLSQKFVRGDELDAPFGVILNDASLYFHRDRLGSISEVSDASGKIVEKAIYDAFGVSSSQLTRGYTGQVFDAETGFYYMRNRYYSPQLGQFLTRDPLGYKNEFYATSTLSQPYSFSFHQNLGAAPRSSLSNKVGETLMDSNLYAPHLTPQNGRDVETDMHMYVGNSPLNMSDPLGLYFMRLDRSKNAMGLYDKMGMPVRYWEAHTQGQSRDRGMPGGDTPTGIYKVGWMDAGSQYRHQGKADPKSIGLGFIQLDPERIEVKVPFKMRSDLAIHGGGLDKRGKRVPDPYAPQQGWLQTRGCVRMQNEDIEELVADIRSLNRNGDKDGHLVVYDGALQLGANRFNDSVRWDSNYIPAAAHINQMILN